MALDHDARLGELIGELGGDRARDLFRELLQRALQELIDTELTAAIGAGPPPADGAPIQPPQRRPPSGALHSGR